MANDYWRKREQEHIKKQLKNDAVIAKRIRQKQMEAMEEIQTQVEAFYGRYADKEGISMGEARKRVRKLDIDKYAKKAKRYVKERDFTKQANEEMRIYNVTMKINRLQLLRLNIELELMAAISDEERILLQELTKQARSEYERQSGILGESLNHNEKNIKSIVNSSFLSASWSDRLWSNQTALRSELDKLLNRSIVQGKNPRELARDLRKTFDISINNSERLLRTELARVQQNVFQDSMKQADIEQYEYIAEPTACDICSELDGKKFKVSEAMPGENAFPMHPNCRCSQAAYVDRDAWERSMDERGLNATNEGSDTLPNYKKAIIPDGKLTKYALDPNGSAPDKAIAFERALGYNKENYKDLIQNVRDNLSKYRATPKGENEWGQRNEVIMQLTGPNGKEASVLTAWIIDKKTGETRLTSIYVTNKRVKTDGKD